MSSFQSFQDTALFNAMELKVGSEEFIGDFYDVRENFIMLFKVLPDYDETVQRKALDYYNNFRVKISYPRKLTIEGKFIIENGELGGYFHTDPATNEKFKIDDEVYSIINNKKIKENIEASYAITMISRGYCNLVYWFDYFLQDGGELENSVTLTNAIYYRIPPDRRTSCKGYMINPNQNPAYAMDLKVKPVVVGGKRKKKRIMRTKRKRNKRTRRTKRAVEITTYTI